MPTERQLQLARWATEVELLPEGYEPIPEQIDRATFAVAVGENHLAPTAERYAVSAARVTVLEGRANPLPGEPFTTYFSRRTLAAREYERLRRELG